MSNELTIVEQKQVAFYSDQITAVLVEKPEGERVVYVPIRPICDLLGVTWTGQRRRINRDAVLSKATMFVNVTFTDITDNSKRPKNSRMLALPLDYLNGFLFGINADRAKPEVREQLIRYQTDCYRVLSEAFQAGQLSFDQRYSDLLKSDSPAAKAVRMAQAILEMAQHQLIMESRIDEHEQRLRSLEEWRGDIGRTITPAQAQTVSEGVKMIAAELTQTTGRSQYQTVYMELYRRYGITSYKLLPSGDYEKALNWLRQWFEDLTDNSAPF